MKNRTIFFEKRPEGKPTEDCFRIEKNSVSEIKEGEVLLKTKYVSVDPYLRGRMSDRKSYTSGFILGEPIHSGIIAEVVESKNADFKEGDFVSGLLDWSEYQTSNGESLTKVDPDAAPLSAYLGMLGMPGLTAYLGLMEIGQPRKGETLVVSGAAGAVGSVVGQIGKNVGCRVVGIAGSDTKTEILKTEFGFDEAINYKTTKNMRKAITNSCPNGVDVYFDNVGGEISDGVMMNINQFARVPICGAISQYNETRMTTGPRMQSVLLINRALMQGFIVHDFASKFPDALQQLTQWYNEGKLKLKETIVEGFENIPDAFIGLFEGENIGKMIVKI
ncbi:MAG TPA: NADP-dependent oxidoreductase [Tangfeifania sp.]|nr:NADP-dependent oxidoreductase [Tangfeifania sp.]